jgi:hypothetical protein
VPTSDPIAVQMQAIHERWGSLIARASTATTEAGSVPPALLAAIIANESDGDPNANRFEPEVLLALWDVLTGRKAAFGSIGRADLAPLVFVAPPAAVKNLDALATSWGLTQIMGYNFLAGVDKLTDPETNLYRATGMLAAFAKQFELDFVKDAADVLNCWNTGHPVTTPAPDEYVQNGLARMAAYQALLSQTAPAAPTE